MDGSFVNESAAKSRPAIGLTGGIGCGKSRVAEFLKSAGAMIIDADEIAHALVARGTPLLGEIGRRFGAEILLPDGSLNRRELNRRVFQNPALRKELEGLLHPPIVEQIQQKISHAFTNHFSGPVIISAPLLFETGLERLCRATLVIACTETTQIKRLQERDGYSAQEALARIQAQMPLDEKRRRATWVVENDGSLDELKSRIDALWPALQRALA